MKLDLDKPVGVDFHNFKNYLFFFYCEGKDYTEYKVGLKLMASFSVDFDESEIKPKSQDTENYDLATSLVSVPLCSSKPLSCSSSILNHPQQTNKAISFEF